MSISSPDSPPTEVPEADWAEQSIDADPLAEADGEPGERRATLAQGSREADEADLAEQETIAYVDDEDLR